MSIPEEEKGGGRRECLFLSFNNSEIPKPGEGTGYTLPMKPKNCPIISTQKDLLQDTLN